MDEDTLCSRCRCCTMEYVQCDTCGGEGVDGHDCGEDICCCLDPEENETCDICRGAGGWWMCGGRCDDQGQHRDAGT